MVMIRVSSKLKAIGRASFLTLHGICFVNIALAACHNTPSMAVAAESLSSANMNSERGGYRLKGIQSDPVLRQAWAMVIRCDHPEWPAVALPLNASILPSQLREQESAKYIPASVVIRAGEIVRLWSQEISSRIEVTGISEGNGRLGELIKVRL